MSLTSVRASTQDATTGTPVAAVANRDDSTKAIQANALVGVKTDYTVLSRTSVSSADASTDMSTSGFGTSLGDVGNSMHVELRAQCDTASKNLTGTADPLRCVEQPGRDGRTSDLLVRCHSPHRGGGQLHVHSVHSGPRCRSQDQVLCGERLWRDLDRRVKSDLIEVTCS
jgi:hypothetical protein